MPHLLSPPIRPGRDGVWGEGAAYEVRNLWRVQDPGPPPVHYDQHLLRPHSITHAESPGHVVAGGAGLDPYFARPEHLWGVALVVRLAPRYEPVDGWLVHEVTADELAPHLVGHDHVGKVLVTTEDVPLDDDGHHALDHALVLSEPAARLLVDRPAFDLFGTSWRSVDHRPDSADRPVHRLLLERAVVLEYLDLVHVPAGRYLLVGFPVRLAGATEAPVTPVLFTHDELARALDGFDPPARGA